MVVYTTAVPTTYATYAQEWQHMVPTITPVISMNLPTISRYCQKMTSLSHFMKSYSCSFYFTCIQCIHTNPIHSIETEEVSSWSKLVVQVMPTP